MEELFDTHAHLDFPDFDRDRDEVIARARATGVRYMVTVGSGGGLQSGRAAVALAEKYAGIWATVGVHPHDAKLMDGNSIAGLRDLAQNQKVVAIGEIGLDYAKEYSPRETQIARFREQLALAREIDLPIVIHDRDAHGDLMKILREDGIPKAGGIMHCFAGDAELALRLIALGFYISFPGVVTYKNAGKSAEAAWAVPLEKILVETDCPFLTPVPHRGKRNEPAYVKFTAQAVAGIKGIAFEELARKTTENAFAAFHLR